MLQTLTFRTKALSATRRVRLAEAEIELTAVNHHGRLQSNLPHPVGLLVKPLGRQEGGGLWLTNMCD